jgi:hypothetical protein
MSKKLFEPENLVQLIIEYVGKELVYNLIRQDDWAKYVFQSESSLMRDLNSLEEVSARKRVLIILVEYPEIMEELLERGITCEGANCFQQVVTG